MIFYALEDVPTYMQIFQLSWLCIQQPATSTQQINGLLPLLVSREVAQQSSMSIRLQLFAW